LPSSAANGNSLAQIDPFAGTVGTPVFIGSEPGRLAISDNSQYIYASLDGAAAVRRFDIGSQTAGIQFALGSDQSTGPFAVEDMGVMPGQPDTVAISRRTQSGGSPRSRGVAIYDNGIVRTVTTPQNPTTNLIEFSSSPSRIYGINTENSEDGFRRMTVNSDGVTVNDTTREILVAKDIKYAEKETFVYGMLDRSIACRRIDPYLAFRLLRNKACYAW
jgi:hypothetical protein